MMGRSRPLITAGLHLIAFLLTGFGNIILANAVTRYDETALQQGAPFLLLGIALWLVAGFQRQPHPVHTNPAPDSPQPARPSPWIGLHPFRVIGLVTGLTLSLLALVLNTGNRFTALGLVAWLGSVAVWGMALASFPRQRPRLRWPRPNRTWLLLAAILLIGATFRLYDLPDLPGDMTRDQAENVLDAKTILAGEWRVFFPNNTGREPFQMYATALLAQVPGRTLDFDTVRLLSVIEGLLTLVVIYRLGHEVFQDLSPQYAANFSLLMTFFVATSYWHTVLSRMGLRLVLLPMMTALLLIFLLRALRHNRRNDWLLTGLVLGVSLYTYLAARILPLLLLTAAIIGCLMIARTLRERARYLIHLALAALMAFIVFIPLFGYSLESPDVFWQRISGRLVGEQFEAVYDGTGALVTPAPQQSAGQVFWDNLAQFAGNIRNALLMFNWKGDEAWVNNIPYHPALDILTGTLFLLGAASWVLRLIRQRTAADWLITAAFIIMLIPSALSIAYPTENPSATRMSGTLPLVYLFIAFALFTLMQRLRDALPVAGQILAITAIASSLAVTGLLNADLYFNRYRATYDQSVFPYRDAARTVQDFAAQYGYGNVFIIGGYPAWIHYAVIAIEQGELDWPNGIYDATVVPAFLYSASERTGSYQFNPEAPILFLFAHDDPTASTVLKQWFPSGQETTLQSTPQRVPYVIYQIPALGTSQFAAFIAQQAQ